MIKRVFKIIGVVVVVFILAITISLLNYAPQEKFVIPEGTKFIAHRGHSSQYYDNSEQAFLSAAQNEFFFAIETDIWLTGDGVWVCAHDANPFEDESINLLEITYEQAASLPLKSSSDYPQNSVEGVRLISLQRYLEICYEYDKMAVIELKYTPDSQKISQLVDFVKNQIPLERVQFISFHHENINKLKSLDEDVMIQTLSSNLVIAMFHLEGDNNVGINQNIASNSIIQKAKEKKGIINVWTVNDIEKARELVAAGVDYITTDYIFEL